MEATITDTEEEDESSEEDALIEAINRLELADSSRESYAVRIGHFVQYLRRTDPDLVLSDDTFDLRQLHLKQFELFLLHKHETVSFSTLEVRARRNFTREFAFFCSTFDFF